MIWLPSSGFFLPLAVFIQIGPAAKVQIFRLAVVVLRELRHSQIPLLGGSWDQLLTASPTISTRSTVRISDAAYRSRKGFAV